MSAPRTIVPPGYNPSLDRLPPRPAGGCSGAMVLAVAGLLVIVVGMIMIVRSMLMPSQPAPVAQLRQITEFPTETAPATVTPDDWSATGTALYHATITPTVDYCWWLTPTNTAIPTLHITPDAWSATGTAIYYATNPAAAATATPDIPKAWCDHIPTDTPTLTPLSLNGMDSDSTAEPTAVRTNTPVPPTETAVQPTAFPTVYVPPSGDAPPAPAPTMIYVYPTATDTVVPMPPTDKPPKPTKTPTFTPSETASVVPLPTEAATNTATATETHTPTATETPTFTPTPSLTPTLTFTPTFTATATCAPTVTPTNTEMPTEIAPVPVMPTFTPTEPSAPCMTWG